MKEDWTLKMKNKKKKTKTNKKKAITKVVRKKSISM